MKKSFYFFIFFLFTTIQPFVVKAQETTNNTEEKPAVEYINGNKYIYVDRLHFSPNMTIWEFLQLFPELSFRGSQDVLNNYSIVLDDYSLGTNRDEVLYQMTLGELSHIIISDNPSVAYAKNGVGGTITLVPKSLEEGLSGNAQLDVSTEKSVLASTNINYKKDKLQIRSYLKGEYVNYLENYSQHYYGTTRYNLFDYDEHTVGTNEIAKISVGYKASDKDDITVAIWETYGFSKQENEEINSILHVGTRYDTINKSGIGTLALFSYEHDFNDYHHLSVDITYSFSNTKKGETFEETSYSQPHELDVDFRYVGALLHRNAHTLKLVTGFDYSGYFTKSGKPSTLQSGYTHISPLLEFRYVMKDKLSFRMGARYHYDSYRALKDDETTPPGHDYMAGGELDYTPVPGHTLRWSAVRDRICSSIGHHEGYVTAADISYIFQKSINSNYINITAGFQYDRVQMLDNRINNVYAAKAALTWQRKWLCLSLTGHLFDNQTYHEKMGDYKLYYNLRLTPIFSLPKDWFISANFMYNSPMTSKLISSGGYFYSSLRICKQLGKWSVHAELSDPFHYRTTDKYYLSEEHLLENQLFSEKTYNPYHLYLNMGVMYTF